MAATNKAKAAAAQRAAVEQGQKLEVRALQQKQQEIAKVYKAQEKVEVIISPMYQAHFGKNMPVVINGIPVWVPCDGRGYKIPKSYAAIVKSRIRKVDDQIQRSKTLSNVSGNFEQYAGQRDLIQRT